MFAVRVRLGGTGSSASEGYVEALGTNGQWGGVCDDYFDINDAHVICRMLGYPSAIAAVDAQYTYGYNPSGNSYVLNNLNCDGSELSAFDCSHNGEWQENCGPSEIAGVQCESKLYQISIQYFGILS